MKTCKKCGHQYKRLRYGHKAPCDRTPPPDELAKILTNNPSMTITKLRRKYNVGEGFIRKRLSGTCWTKDKLYERNERVRLEQMTAKEDKKYFSLSYISRKCVCGILLEEHETRCRFCIEESLGIKNYKTRYGLDKE